MGWAVGVRAGWWVCGLGDVCYWGGWVGGCAGWLGLRAGRVDVRAGPCRAVRNQVKPCQLKTCRAVPAQNVPWCAKLKTCQFKTCRAVPGPKHASSKRAVPCRAKTCQFKPCRAVPGQNVPVQNVPCRGGQTVPCVPCRARATLYIWPFLFCRRDHKSFIWRSCSRGRTTPLLNPSGPEHQVLEVTRSHPSPSRLQTQRA